MKDKMKLWDTLTALDISLSQLDAMISVLHTACGARDEIDLETVQAYADAMHDQLCIAITQHNEAQQLLKAVLADQDDLEGAPLLYTDEKGKQRIFWDQDPED